MNNIDKVIDAFVTGDYFVIFLILTVAILVVLVLALIKSRGEYNELLSYELEKSKRKNVPNVIPDDSKIDTDNDSLIKDLEDLMVGTKEEAIDENKPLIKQIDLPNVKTYDDIIDEYEYNEEENAVISAEELEKRTKERQDAYGATDNQIAIQAYEEEQEKKAIISYEQLLKNAQNITLSYKEDNKEKVKDKDAPVITKVEVEKKEVVGTEIYLEEEEFLKILKDFRLSLNENIFN